MNFREWMERIDAICFAKYRLSIYDLPDMLFRDAYDGGQSPEEFIEENVGDLDALEELIVGS